jgi:hypothetical protein
LRTKIATFHFRSGPARPPSRPSSVQLRRASAANLSAFFLGPIDLDSRSEVVRRGLRTGCVHPDGHQRRLTPIRRSAGDRRSVRGLRL